MDILLVGEAPGPSGAQPTNGWATRIGFIHARKENLLQKWPGQQGKGSRFPVLEARPLASFLHAREPATVNFVLMGRVAHAFKVKLPYLEWAEVDIELPHGPLDRVRKTKRTVAICPHPSGINRWWNSEENREQARAFFENAGVPLLDRRP